MSQGPSITEAGDVRLHGVGRLEIGDEKREQRLGSLAFVACKAPSLLLLLASCSCRLLASCFFLASCRRIFLEVI